MKTLFIPAKRKLKLDKKKVLNLFEKLPNNLVLFYSIQYEDYSKKIKQELTKNSFNIQEIKQVLGCSSLTNKKIKIPNNSEAIVLIGSGSFHALNLSLQTSLPVYILEENSIKKVDKKQAERIKKNKDLAYKKFLGSKTIGVFISTKPGQQRMKRALELKEKYSEKEFYFFTSNNFNLNETENFPEIQMWVNTACPRIDLDFFEKNVINLDDLES